MVCCGSEQHGDHLNGDPGWGTTDFLTWRFIRPARPHRASLRFSTLQRRVARKNAESAALLLKVIDHGAWPTAITLEYGFTVAATE